MIDSLYRDELGLVAPAKCDEPAAQRDDLQAVRRRAMLWITWSKRRFSTVCRQTWSIPRLNAALRASMLSLVTSMISLALRSQLTTRLRCVGRRSISRRPVLYTLGSRPGRMRIFSEKFSHHRDQDQEQPHA